MRTHPFLRDAASPKVFAHRGLIAAVGEEAPVGGTPPLWENSALAFAAAHAAGTTYFETDCRVTADGDVVLFHDATLQRVASDPRALNTVPTRELAEMFSSHGGLLTLAGALDTFPTARFNVDVKERAAARGAGEVAARHPERVLLTSFDDTARRAALDASRRAGARISPATSPGRRVLAALLATVSVGWSRRARRILASLDALQIPVTYGPVPVMTRRLVQAAHAAGVEVHVWTIDDPRQMVELVRRGADGIVTNRADLAVSLLQSH